MKRFKSSFTLGLLLMFSLSTATADEMEWRSYSDSVINSVRNDQVTLLGFHKKGCSTCAVQDSTLAPLLKDNRFSHIVPVKIHMGEEESKSVVKRYKVLKQSTLILLKNGKEIARTIPGTTNSKEIKTFLETTL